MTTPLAWRVVTTADSPTFLTWSGGTSVRSGEVRVRSSDRALIRRLTDGTTRPTYDTTEELSWELVGGSLAGGSASAATETAAGVVELATAAETVLGTSTSLAAHPAGVKAAVAAAIAALVGGAPGALDTLVELAAQLTADESAAASLATTVAGKADKVSPALTGSPTVNGVAIATATSVSTAVNAAVTALVNGAPGALDTLSELANSLVADEAAAATLATLVGTKASKIAVATSVLTANTTPALDAVTGYDATAGALTVALPSGMADGRFLAVRKADTSTNTVTLTGTINGASASRVLRVAQQVVYLVSGAGGWWTIADGNVTNLDGRYAPITQAVPAPGIDLRIDTFSVGGAGTGTAITGGFAYSGTVTFATPFPTGWTVKVLAVITGVLTGSPAIGRYAATPTNVTTTGFTAGGTRETDGTINGLYVAYATPPGYAPATNGGGGVAPIVVADPTPQQTVVETFSGATPYFATPADTNKLKVFTGTGQAGTFALQDEARSGIGGYFEVEVSSTDMPVMVTHGGTVTVAPSDASLVIPPGGRVRINRVDANRYVITPSKRNGTGGAFVPEVLAADVGKRPMLRAATYFSAASVDEDLVIQGVCVGPSPAGAAGSGVSVYRSRMIRGTTTGEAEVWGTDRDSGVQTYYSGVKLLGHCQSITLDAAGILYVSTGAEPPPPGTRGLTRLRLSDSAVLSVLPYSPMTSSSVWAYDPAGNQLVGVNGSGGNPTFTLLTMSLTGTITSTRTITVPQPTAPSVSATQGIAVVSGGTRLLLTQTNSVSGDLLNVKDDRYSKLYAYDLTQSSGTLVALSTTLLPLTNESEGLGVDLATGRAWLGGNRPGRVLELLVDTP